ncbi:MAG: hypothetical protein KKH68_01785, partial [Proteobacteria bacterium]|nr:hypothetical protein [Pseudomonadota bacterium]
TNSNYNNRDNTDFIARILTGIGIRKCFLVYRVYPSFDEAEVREHAMTVARNLYGHAADQYVLGIYRTDEDNTVAAGKRFMTLRPVGKNNLAFINALKSIDSRKLRLELLGSLLENALAKARNFIQQIQCSHNELQLYHDALLTAQSHCVQQALKHFPLDLVLKSFAEIWMAKDPPHVKVMRKTGSIIDWPFKLILNTARRVMGKPVGEKTGDYEKKFKDKVKEDLLQAVNRMHYYTVSSEISVFSAAKDPATRQMLETVEQIRAAKGIKDAQHPHVQQPDEKGQLTFSVTAHPAVSHEQDLLRKTDWQSVLQAILARRDIIFEMSDGIEMELNRLAESFRRKMGLWSKIRQTFFAMLNVVPATVAITYVLSTGDPVGAAGVKVKLTGLFGLHDLYALVAIPTTTGLKKTDLKQLDAMLGPIVLAWLNNKLSDIQDIFEQKITGGIIRAATKTLANSAELTRQIEVNLETCAKAWKP